jgi:iron complex transport system ATP-binding protein
VIAAVDVSVRLDGHLVLDGVSLTVAAGEWVSVVGPNGAGKSTLVRALAGLVAAGGEVSLGSSPLTSLSRRDRARLVAVVPQAPVVPPGMPVADYVLLGRTPYIPPLGRESQADLAAVGRALEQLDLLAFADRPLDTLSGGERQRVLIARALAQAAPILLLDEPTTALDVGHQQDVLELVDRLRRDNGLTVLSTMHDLTLAGQYADRLVLLDHGHVVVSGTADEVLTEEHLSRFYGARVRVLREGNAVVVVPVRAESEARLP